MPSPDTPVPIGVYRTSMPDISAIERYESFLGMPSGATVNYVLAFMPDTPASWAQFEQAVLAASTNGPPSSTSATAWAPLLGSRQLILAVPACCMGSTWATEAAGTNDAHWAALAHTLVNGGLGNCVLRIGREFSGGWYRWDATPSNVSTYVAGYAHVVSVMRAAGFTGKFMWNPYIGQGTFRPEGDVGSAYPGDSVVDVIGIDLYDGPDPVNYPAGKVIRTAAQHQAVWNEFLSGRNAITGWHSLAASHSKPLAYPEWGLRLWQDSGVYRGGGDNPVLIREMAAWLKGTGAWMHALWEDAGQGVADPDDLPARQVAVPQAREAFLENFGWPVASERGG